MASPAFLRGRRVHRHLPLLVWLVVTRKRALDRAYHRHGVVRFRLVPSVHFRAELLG